MKITRAAISLITVTSLFLISATASLAQEASPSPSPSTSPSPSPSPSSSPSSSPASDASPSPTSEGGTTKEEVLGESTKLGETSTGREIAKWAFAISLGLGALYFTIKTVRSKAEE